MAVENGFIQGNILDITDKVIFDALKIKIQELPAFKQRNASGNNRYSNALNRYSEFLASIDVIQPVEEDIEKILFTENNNPTEAARLISTRIGQGQFRKSLLKY